ncbi:hypothetical protein Tco_0242490 [Tanacetum coccineum]
MHSSSDVIPAVVQTATPNSEHVTKWTKDHPLDNIIVTQKTYKDCDSKRAQIPFLCDSFNELKPLSAWLVARGYRHRSGNDFEESFLQWLDLKLFEFSSHMLST